MESSYALLLESANAKKLQTLKNLHFSAKSNYIENACKKGTNNNKFLNHANMQNFWQNLQTFFAICYFIGRRAENYQNLTTESGSKQRFSLSKEKVVIQAVCPRTQAVSIKA